MFSVFIFFVLSCLWLVA